MQIKEKMLFLLLFLQLRNSVQVWKIYTIISSMYSIQNLISILIFLTQ